MTIYDISVETTPDLPVWPGDPKVKLERFQMLEKGASANVSQVAMGLHTGTHVDAPFHFLPEGVTLDKIALERFVGTAAVVEIPFEVDVISDETVSLNPLGSVTSKARVPHGVSCGSLSRVTPAAFARAARASIS